MTMVQRSSDPKAGGNGRASTHPALPRLPVLGWASFSGPRDANLEGVLSASYRCYALSGRSAIALALRACGVQAGDRVLVPTYHCPSMIAPVVGIGAQPAFYPIVATGAPDLRWIQRQDLHGVRAILVAHHFGLPQPMASLRSFCDDSTIALIEDCAHAFFGTSDGRPVGSWGDYAIASLPKFFPVRQGGLLLSAKNPIDRFAFLRAGLLEEIKAAIDVIELGAMHARFFGINTVLTALMSLKNRFRARAAYSGSVNGIGAGDEEQQIARDRKPWKSPARVATWISERVHQKRIVEVRRRNYLDLLVRFSDARGARPLMPHLPDAVAPYVFPLYVEDPEAVYQQVRAAGIPIFRWDELWPGTPTLEQDYGSRWSTHVFQLGCHQDLRRAEIAAMADGIRCIIERNVR